MIEHTPEMVHAVMLERTQQAAEAHRQTEALSLQRQRHASGIKATGHSGSIASGPAPSTAALIAHAFRSPSQWRKGGRVR